MRRQGFTLLEVVVAMAMLSLGLMAIFDLNSRAIELHAYGKKLTVATLLARGRMVEIEQTLIDDGFPSDDDEESGDFSQEGWPSFKWRAQILAPRTQGASPTQILAAVLNLPVPEGAEGDLAAVIGTMMGMSGGEGGGPAQALPPEMAQMIGLAQPYLTQFVDQLTKQIRKVHLTVYWQDGNQVEQVELVTHVVSTGQGSDRNPNNPQQQALPPGGPP